jgi:HlyD family secretion protein
MKERNRIFVLLAVILVIAGAYYWFSTDHTKELVYTGIVDANQVVVNARIAGRIERLAVDEGADVKTGDLIAVLDSGELTAQKQAMAATIASLRSQVAASQATEESTKGETSSGVSNAQAQIQAAKSQLDEARETLLKLQQDDQRIQKLASEGVASKQERDRSEQDVRAQQARVQSLSDQVKSTQAALATAQARTHQAHAAESTVSAARSQAANAEAQLAEVETRLGFTRVLAPVNGTISVRVARQGEVVAMGEPIVTVVDLNDTWVRASVPETIGTNIAIGDKYGVRLPSGEVIQGTVIAKAAEGDFATQRDVNNKKRDIKTLSLKLKVDNSQRRLVPGMTADLLLPQSSTTAKPTEAER